MVKNYDDKKKIERAEYRASIAEAELNAIRQSKAYKTARSLSVIKNKIKSDPVGLTKKVAKIIINNPKKLRYIGKSASRVEQMSQASIEQTGKYQEWIILNEPDEPELDKQRTQSDLFKKKPLISIVTPVFNPPADVLESLIESVLEQTYPNFELCLGDFGDSEEIDSLLSKYSKLDARIKYKKFDDNRGISGNSNQILNGLVNGDFIALLDHDDTLSPDALFENVKKINQDDYDFLYSDKDKIDVEGNRFEPLFKPQLSPDMLLNINYLTHLNVMKTSVVKSIGGWDESTDGAQDWDLFLRVIDAANKVAHIPKVLYHWRVIASSTALSIETKPYALAGQRKAVDKYLEHNGIKAKSYHRQTELFLKWSEEVIDRSPIVFIYFSNISNSIRIIRHIRKNTNNAKFVLLVCSPMVLDESNVERLKETVEDIDICEYEDGGLFGAISGLLPKDNTTALFIKDSIRLPGTHWYEDLVGWVSVNEIGAVSGRIVDQYDVIVDSGGFITAEGSYYPIFQNFPKFYQSYIGNAEWVRDLSIISSNFFATKTELLNDFNFSKKKQINPMFDDFFLWMGQNEKRMVLTPHVTGMIHDGNQIIDQNHKLNGLKFDKNDLYQDVFSNPNMNRSDPFRLFKDEDIINSSTGEIASIDKYQSDAIILAESFDISEQEIEINRKLINSTHNSLESVAWFLPSYDAVYAGLMNIFRFANYLGEKRGLKTTFYILKNSSNVDDEKDRAVNAFPYLANAKFVGIRPDQISSIKKHDMGVATQWATAYPLAKTTNIGRKFYFIQDNESNFYPSGTISSLVDLTYRFGFTAIANTEGLLDMYRKKYGGDGVVVKSYVDLSSYFPREDVYYKPKKPYKVFFYARPNMPRNAFELGIAGLKKLKEQLGDDVEIITAGEKWNADSYGVGGMFTNLGRVEYNSVPKLYRSIDAGLMFMFSGHPGVVASELMASGCPVVVNEYDDITWHELYKDGMTCLTTKATASEVARNIRRCLEESDLRKKLIDGGLDIVGDFYSGYDESCEQAFERLTDNSN